MYVLFCRVVYCWLLSICIILVDSCVAGCLVALVTIKMNNFCLQARWCGALAKTRFANTRPAKLQCDKHVHIHFI